jgi:hypothetical protein
MAQGFAFGTGSAIARVAVNSMMGGGSSDSAPAAAAPAAPAAAAPAADSEYSFAATCDIDQKAFMKCLNENNGSTSSCDFYYQALQACQSRN